MFANERKIILKKKIIKSISMMLAVLMLMATLAVASSAQDSSVTVNFCAFDGEVFVPKTEITVTDGLAEAYGYDVAEVDHNGNVITEVTIFDVIVAVHEYCYGDLFTPETAENYLVMNTSFITKAFGRNSASIGMFLNDRMPNDGIYNESYGSYTGLACDTAPVSDGDLVTFFYYQDLYSWGDYKAEFSADAFEVSINEDVELEVTAFSSWYGNSTEDVVAANSVAVPGAEIVYESSDGVFETLAVTDADGKATVSFSEAGEYVLYIKGSVSDGYGGKAPLVTDVATVLVEEPTDEPADDPAEDPSEEPSDEMNIFEIIWSFIVNIFNRIVNFFKSVFSFLF